MSAFRLPPSAFPLSGTSAWAKRSPSVRSLLPALARLPWSILAATAFLMVLGCIGIARWEELVEGSGRFLRQQIVWSVLGLLVMLGATLPSYRRICPWGYLIFAIALVALGAVYACRPINGAHRWIRLGPLGLQPSEFAKVAFVLAAARYLMYRENYRRLPGLLAPLALASVPIVLILKEPDLGTASVFLPVLLAMLFVAGARRIDLATLLLAGLMLLPLFWTQMSREQRSRVTAMFDQPTADRRPTADQYQLYQGKQMLALGGTWGSLWQGAIVDDPAVYRLPEAQTDFVFCVLGERLGLPGVALVLGLFGFLVWRIAAVAAACREPFGRLLAAGVATLLGVEVLVNTGMTVGLLPVTGLPLPMVSYGGSGLVAHALALGLVLNVALRPGYEVTDEPFRYRVADE